MPIGLIKGHGMDSPDKPVNDRLRERTQKSVIPALSRDLLTASLQSEQSGSARSRIAARPG